MDTKSRRIDFSSITKGIAFLLIIISFGIAVTMFENLGMNTHGLKSLSETNYTNTSDLFYYQENFYIGLNNLLKFRNADYIATGNTIDKVEFENKKKDMFIEWYNQISEHMNQKYYEENQDKIDIYNQLKERFETESADRINALYKSMIDSELNDYYALLQRVKNKEGLYYYATNGEDIYTNSDYAEREYFTGFKAYYLFDKDGLELVPSPQNNTKTSHILRVSDTVIGHKIYIAVKDDYIAKNQTILDKERICLQNGINIIICAISVLLIMLSYLIWKAGRKNYDDNVHLIVLDRLYTDFNFLIILTVIGSWIALSAEFIRNGFLRYIILDLSSIKADFWLMVLFNTVFCSVGLIFLLSLIRHFKNKTLIKHSLTYFVFLKLRDIVKNMFVKIRVALGNIFNSGPLMFRIVGVIVFSEFVVFLLTLMMFLGIHSAVAVLLSFIILCGVSVSGIYYVILKTKQFSDITKGVQEIKNGNLDYVIEISGNGDLAKLAGDINDITDGLKNAVAKETKAERMKSELITNVSHDLKTPLTSIINYVDLLSKENLMPDEANDYVAVLKQKSEKLKTLTQDLFEISNVQSGNISVDVERLDLSLLIRQSLAEFDEQILSSGLNFKVDIQDYNIYTMADGKRLSRVFENLISNILKYSLQNTRVYIDAFTDKNDVVIEFKNIANYEMNFKQDEIVERFVRGDNSRTTDGNGLGLAIAQSYVVACGGKIEVNVDGDLFKATIRFNKV